MYYMTPVQTLCIAFHWRGNSSMKEYKGSHLYLEPFLHISLTDNICSERHKYAFSVRFMWEDLFVCSYSRAGTANLQGALHFNPNLMWLVWPSLIRFFQSFSFVCFSPPYFFWRPLVSYSIVYNGHYIGLINVWYDDAFLGCVR